MNFNKELLEKKASELSEQELLECFEYSVNLNTGISAHPYNKMIVYYNELQKRENNKSNKIMKSWTIAIGIMTGVMLLATIVNVIVSVFCNG